jgi:hypothetical protein
VQLIVMHDARTWRVAPGDTFTFGRAPDCTAVLPTADRGISRHAGSLRHHDGWWWLHNDSDSCVLCLLGDRGLRIDLPPGLQVPLQQWRAEVILTGALDRYTLRLRLPDLDDLPDPGVQSPPAAERAVTSTRYRARLSDTDRLVLAARFEAYLARRRAAPGKPRNGSAGSPTPWPSDARTSATATCGLAPRGCAGRARWKNSRCCSSPPAN